MSTQLIDTIKDQDKETLIRLNEEYFTTDAECFGVNSGNFHETLTDIEVARAEILEVLYCLLIENIDKIINQKK